MQGTSQHLLGEVVAMPHVEIAVYPRRASAVQTIQRGGWSGSGFTQPLPAGAMEAARGLVLAVGAAADVEEGFHQGIRLYWNPADGFRLALPRSRLG